MASVLSGPCLCAASSVHTPREWFSRCKGDAEDRGEVLGTSLASCKRNRMVVQGCAAGLNVGVGCLVSRSGYQSRRGIRSFRSLTASRISSRELRNSELESECIFAIGNHGVGQDWRLEVAEVWGVKGRQCGRCVSIFAAAGEGQGNVAESSGEVDDSNVGLENVIGKGSRVGGDKSVEIEDSSLRGESDVGDGMQSPLSENLEDLGKIAESATARVFENAGRKSKFTEGSRMAEEGASNAAVVLDGAGFWRQVALATDAGVALEMIAEKAGSQGGVVSNEDCSKLILEALVLGNSELAFSVLNAMRSSVIQRRIGRDEKSSFIESWRWAQPNVNTYATLVRGLAASLRVADAIEVVADVRRRGVPAGDEVPFGKVIGCPTCRTALAVVQPQQGVQVAPCAKCRYEYELMSGTVVECESESISMNISVFERGFRLVKLLKRPVPAAVHSLVVRAPDGLARTHRCATESADIPAQEGERVTVISAAPANAVRGIGPFKTNARAPGWRPSEPMAITNHVTGRISSLSRPPPKSGSGAAFDASLIIPAVLLFASSDAATALIDPSLPRAIAIGAASVVAIGGATNAFVLPRINQLPQRTVDALALRQQLLAQHEKLQARLEDLTQAAADDVRMLARMCQLQNKMEAVNEPTYSARMERVQKARETLDERLEGRLELIYSYAKYLT
ncbi:uncharacterized protein [Physcomitrium patens]|uniref:uncharacterized protein isoform X2 n=1 Tax=Physcomitrium patens TaxID=3218 RepID=UPI003CCDF0B2